jgi:hypothetical protein
MTYFEYSYKCNVVSWIITITVYFAAIMCPYKIIIWWCVKKRITCTHFIQYFEVIVRLAWLRHLVAYCWDGDSRGLVVVLYCAHEDVSQVRCKLIQLMGRVLQWITWQKIRGQLRQLTIADIQINGFKCRLDVQCTLQTDNLTNWCKVCDTL